MPALLQGVPQESLDAYGISKYEISPVEPLHDIKGHLSNIIQESRALISGNTKQKIEDICLATIEKETLRGSDYRKAAILILLALIEFQPTSSLTQLFQTVVEITDLLYSDPGKRTPQAILRLHNITFVHAKLCINLFGKPKTMSSRKLFGRYYHALTSHSPLLQRIITPRLLNAETEERMFGQCKPITRCTSNQHAHHIITNILVRLNAEEQAHENEINTQKKQENDIKKLAQVLPPKQNTVIPYKWLSHHSIHYQAHLERISDYLVLGPGMWWQYIQDGVEFFDVQSPSNIPVSPAVFHFRSTSLQDVDLHLLSVWEKCVEDEVRLPASKIETYTANGNLLARSCQQTQAISSNSLPPCPTSGPDQQTQALSSNSLPLCPTSGPDQQTQALSSNSLPPCPTSGPDQQTQALSSNSLHLCPNSGPGQHTQALSFNSLPSCPTSGPDQQTQALSFNSLPPCPTSGPDQQTQALSFNSHPPCPTSGQPRSKHPQTALARCLQPIVPQYTQEELLAFDALRCKVKAAKGHDTSSHFHQTYKIASTNIREKLIDQLKKNIRLLTTYKINYVNTSAKKDLEHNTNVLKKVLSHEWSFDCRDVL